MSGYLAEKQTVAGRSRYHELAEHRAEQEKRQEKGYAGRRVWALWIDHGVPVLLPIRINAGYL